MSKCGDNNSVYFRAVGPGVPRCLIGCALSATLALSTAVAASAQTRTAAWPVVPESAIGIDTEYHLSVGDVIQISVRGFPDLRQQSVVELNGEVSLPLAGRIKIVDMTIAKRNRR